MSCSVAGACPAQPDLFTSRIRLRRLVNPPPRTMPYDLEPGYYQSGGVWLFGNARLLQLDLGYVRGAFGPNRHTSAQLNEVEAEAERIVLGGRILVCGIHCEAHKRAAVVPLRWGAPRIVVLSGGFRHHLGPELKEELFRTTRLWRYQFDPQTDLVISRRAPDKLPTYATHNPTVDRLIELIVQGQWPGLRFSGDPLENLLARSA